MNSFKKYFSFIFVFVLLVSFSSHASLTNTTFTKPINENSDFTYTLNSPLKKLTLKTFNNDYSVQIFDDEGNTIKSFQLVKNTQVEVSTATFKPGTYYLRYVGTTEKNNSVEKLIIE